MISGLAGIMLYNEPGQYSIRINTSYTSLEVLFQAASIRWTIFGWPFRIRFGPSVRDTKTRLMTVTHHDVNLLLNLSKHRLAWHCDTFKNMACCSVHGRRSPDEVDICESAYQGTLPRSTEVGVKDEPWLRYFSTWTV
jgi:hypothetical protein